MLPLSLSSVLLLLLRPSPSCLEVRLKSGDGVAGLSLVLIAVVVQTCCIISGADMLYYNLATTTSAATTTTATATIGK